MSFLFKFFNKSKLQELEAHNESLNKQISYLESIIKEKDLIVKDLHSKEKSNSVKTSTVKEIKSNIEYSKQWGLIEKNLRNLQLENNNLKQQIKNFEKILPKEQMKFSFLVEIQNFYSSNKFSEIKEKFSENNIQFLQNIETDMFSTFLKGLPHADEALKKYLDFTNNIIEWDIKISLLKGDRVNKIYPKNRKFLNFLSDNNIEFMIELENFDFTTLVNHGFKNSDIDLFKEKKELYFKERKI